MGEEDAVGSLSVDGHGHVGVASGINAENSGSVIRNRAVVDNKPPLRDEAIELRFDGREGGEEMGLGPRGTTADVSTDVASRDFTPDSTWSWIVCAAAFYMDAVSIGIHTCYGPILVALLDTYGESTAKTALIGSISYGIAMLVSPLTSTLSLRIGCRLVTLVGSIISTLALVLTSLVPNIDLMFLTHGVMFGIGTSLVFTPSQIIIGWYFNRHRIVAAAIVSAAPCIGTLTMAPLVQLMIDEFGYKAALRLLAVITSMSAICSATYNPLNVPVYTNTAATGQTSSSWAIVKNPVLIIWVIAISAYTGGNFPIPHMVKLAQDRGLSANTGAILLTMLSGSTAVARLLFGKVNAALKEYHRELEQASMISIGLLLMTVPLSTSLTGLVIFVVVRGLMDGCSVSLMPVYTLDLVGRDNMAIAWGMVWAASSITWVIGTYGAGLIYDATSSYDLAFYIGGVPLILAGIMLGFIPYVNRRLLKNAALLAMMSTSPTQGGQPLDGGDLCRFEVNTMTEARGGPDGQQIGGDFEGFGTDTQELISDTSNEDLYLTVRNMAEISAHKISDNNTTTDVIVIDTGIDLDSGDNLSAHSHNEARLNLHNDDMDHLTVQESFLSIFEVLTNSSAPSRTISMAGLSVQLGASMSSASFNDETTSPPLDREIIESLQHKVATLAIPEDLQQIESEQLDERHPASPGDLDPFPPTGGGGERVRSLTPSSEGPSDEVQDLKYSESLVDLPIVDTSPSFLEGSPPPVDETKYFLTNGYPIIETIIEITQSDSSNNEIEVLTQNELEEIGVQPKTNNLVDIGREYPTTNPTTPTPVPLADTMWGTTESPEVEEGPHHLAVPPAQNEHLSPEKSGHVSKINITSDPIISLDCEPIRAEFSTSPTTGPTLDLTPEDQVCEMAQLCVAHAFEICRTVSSTPANWPDNPPQSNIPPNDDATGPTEPDPLAIPPSLLKPFWVGTGTGQSSADPVTSWPVVTGNTTTDDPSTTIVPSTTTPDIEIQGEKELWYPTDLGDLAELAELNQDPPMFPVTDVYNILSQPCAATTYQT